MSVCVFVSLCVSGTQVWLTEVLGGILTLAGSWVCTNVLGWERCDFFSPLFFSPEMLEIHGSFTWLGQTQYKLQLKSLEVSSLQLKACFVHAGVYNLGTPRVFARLLDQVTLFETSQQNSMPALIIINSIWIAAGLFQKPKNEKKRLFTAFFELCSRDIWLV